MCAAVCVDVSCMVVRVTMKTIRTVVKKHENCAVDDDGEDVENDDVDEDADDGNDDDDHDDDADDDHDADQGNDE